MLNARPRLPAAMRLTQLALCMSAVFAIDHEALATNVTDCSDGAGPNTLRHVIQNAASGAITNVSQCSLITLTAGAIPSALQRLRIQGNGTNVISGGGNSAILHHTGTGGYLLLIDVTIQDGNLSAPTALGGCIYSTENVDLDHVTVKNCVANETIAGGIAKGGGIYTKANVDLRNSVVTGNTVTQTTTTYFKAKGGGIYAQSLTAYNSVLSSNTANFSGGVAGAGKYTVGGGAFLVGNARIYSSTINANVAGKYGGVHGAAVNIVSSTVSSNVALHQGGGVWASGNLIIANSTVAFNSGLQPAFTPAGVYAGGVAKLQSSIISNNTLFSGPTSDLRLGNVASFDAASANNIMTSFSGPVPLPADTIGADPHLLPLADNGGSTALHPVAMTHALRHDSPALNRGNNTFEINFTPITCDQRGNPAQAQSNPPNTDHCNSSGFRRVDTDPLHSLPDIGAYEEQLPNADWIFYDGLEGNYL